MVRRTTPPSQARLDTLVCDDRADGRCECLGCAGHAQRCPALRGHLLPNVNKYVRLTAVTRDGSPASLDLTKLIGLCQNCLAELRKKLRKPEEEPPEGLFDIAEATRKETPLL